jgi:hypothetical protein
MLTRKARLLLSLTAATPLLFAACHDYGILNPRADASGTYELTVFSGHSMPNATVNYPPNDPNFDSRGGSLVATDGTLVLNPNGTFTETNHIIVNVNGASSSNITFTSSGTWTVNGDVFTLYDPNRQRQVTGELAPNFDNNYAVSYIEDGTGTVQPYEYIRFTN